MGRHRYASVKAKAILWIVGLVLTLSSLSLGTFALMRRSLQQVSGMIDTTVVTNDLRILSGSVTEGLPSEIENYSLHPTNDSKERISGILRKINEKIALLEPGVKNDTGRFQLNLVKNMFISTSENFNEIVNKVAANSPFFEVNKLVAAIKENSGLIAEAIQRLISTELSEQQIAKAQLAERADSNRVWLLLTIALSSILGTLFFYIYFVKKTILIPLLNMQDTMAEIASDASDLSVRVRIEHKDEIGKLGKYFNIMADTIQKYKNHLEELVETRTRELKDAQGMLVQSAKLSALGEMAGGVAHEINNPLAIIQLKASQLIELSDDAVPDLARIKTLSSDIEFTVDRIAKIVKGLRSFSRNAGGDPYVTTPLQKILDDTTSLCAEKFKLNGMTLRVHDLPPNLSVECRPTELSQVLLNLLSNSYDATEGKSERWVEIEARELEAGIELCLTDSGDGIPESIRNKIFQPFFTTKEIGKGTGLGLSISKGIIEAHGGAFLLDSKCAHTRFVIRLPKSQAKAS